MPRTPPYHIQSFNCAIFVDPTVPMRNKSPCQNCRWYKVRCRPVTCGESLKLCVACKRRGLSECPPDAVITGRPRPSSSQRRKNRVDVAVQTEDIASELVVNECAEENRLHSPASDDTLYTYYPQDQDVITLPPTNDTPPFRTYREDAHQCEPSLSAFPPALSHVDPALSTSNFPRPPAIPYESNVFPPHHLGDLDQPYGFNALDVGSSAFVNDLTQARHYTHERTDMDSSFDGSWPSCWWSSSAPF